MIIRFQSPKCGCWNTGIIELKTMLHNFELQNQNEELEKWQKLVWFVNAFLVNGTSMTTNVLYWRQQQMWSEIANKNTTWRKLYRMHKGFRRHCVIPPEDWSESSSNNNWILKCFACMDASIVTKRR